MKHRIQHTATSFSQPAVENTGFLIGHKWILFPSKFLHEQIVTSLSRTQALFLGHFKTVHFSLTAGWLTFTFIRNFVPHIRLFKMGVLPPSPHPELFHISHRPPSLQADQFSNAFAAVTFLLTYVLTLPFSCMNPFFYLYLTFLIARHVIERRVTLLINLPLVFLKVQCFLLFRCQLKP